MHVAPFVHSFPCTEGGWLSRRGGWLPRRRDRFPSPALRWFKVSFPSPNRFCAFINSLFHWRPIGSPVVVLIGVRKRCACFCCCRQELRLSSWREDVLRPYRRGILCACWLLLLARFMVGVISGTTLMCWLQRCCNSTCYELLNNVVVLGLKSNLFESKCKCLNGLCCGHVCWNTNYAYWEYSIEVLMLVLM